MEFPVLMLGQTAPADLANDIQTFAMGSTFALYLVAALMFLRFYRKSHDRLFVFFAAAFAILGFNRVAFLLSSVPDENRVHLYAVRVIAFILIIVAIIDKNRSVRQGSGSPVDPPRPPAEPPTPPPLSTGSPPPPSPSREHL